MECARWRPGAAALDLVARAPGAPTRQRRAPRSRAALGARARMCTRRAGRGPPQCAPRPPIVRTRRRARRRAGVPAGPGPTLAARRLCLPLIAIAIATCQLAPRPLQPEELRRRAPKSARARFRPVIRSARRSRRAALMRIGTLGVWRRKRHRPRRLASATTRLWAGSGARASPAGPHCRLGALPIIMIMQNGC